MTEVSIQFPELRDVVRSALQGHKIDDVVARRQEGRDGEDVLEISVIYADDESFVATDLLNAVDAIWSHLNRSDVEVVIVPKFTSRRDYENEKSAA